MHWDFIFSVQRTSLKFCFTVDVSFVFKENNRDASESVNVYLWSDVYKKINLQVSICCVLEIKMWNLAFVVVVLLAVVYASPTVNQFEISADQESKQFGESPVKIDTGKI